MQLNRIITAYRERRHTYALEVYYCLLQKENIPYLVIFYTLMATPKAIIRSVDLVAKLVPDVAPIARNLAYLAKMECLTEIGRVQRLPQYRLSDLGQCVLACFPPAPPVHVQQILYKNQVKTHKAHQHYKWEVLGPQIKQFLQEQFTVSEIARRLGMNYNTLLSYMNRAKLKRSAEPEDEKSSALAHT